MLFTVSLNKFHLELLWSSFVRKWYKQSPLARCTCRSDHQYCRLWCLLQCLQTFVIKCKREVKLLHLPLDTSRSLTLYFCCSLIRLVCRYQRHLITDRGSSGKNLYLNLRGGQCESQPVHALYKVSYLSLEYKIVFRQMYTLYYLLFNTVYIKNSPTCFELC